MLWYLLCIKKKKKKKGRYNNLEKFLLTRYFILILYGNQIVCFDFMHEV